MQKRLFKLLAFLLFSSASLFAQDAKIFGEWELVEARENGRVFYAQRNYENEPKEILAFSEDGSYRKVHQNQQPRTWEGDWVSRDNDRLGFRTIQSNGERVENPAFDNQWKIMKVAEQMLQIAQLTEYGEPRFIYTYYRKS